MESSIIEYLTAWVRNVVAVATTAIYGALLAWLANKGLDIDTEWARQALTAIAAGVVLVAEKALNHFVPMLRPIITALRLGNSLPLYDHEAKGLAEAA